MNWNTWAIVAMLYRMVINQETCSFSMFCQEKNEGVDVEENEENCMNVNLTEATGIYDIGFHPCESQRKYYCNVYDGLIQPNNYKSHCIKRPKTILSYPGGNCNSDNDCRYGICISSICKDSDINKECYRDESCPIGTACFFTIHQGKCKPLLKLHDKCTKSTECQYNQLCAAGACTEMYTIEDNVDISSYKDKYTLNTIESMGPLCKTGFAIELNTSEIKCARVTNAKNLNDKCYENCQYNFNNDIITIPNSCRCGFNSRRSKHCILGSGEKAYGEFLALKIALINNPSHTKYCHTVERFNDGYCAEKLKIDRTVAFRRQVQYYNNKKIDALEYHRMIKADDCIKTVIFDYDTNPIISDKRKCASYSCNDKNEYCLNGTNPLNEEGDLIKIEMNANVCVGEEVCTIPFSFGQGVNSIYEKSTIKGECHPKPQLKHIRLPGEDCSSNSDCYQNQCLLDVMKCKGNGFEEECASHLDCNVGLYCNKKKCQRQRREGESCDSSWDCLNYLGCYSNPGSTTSQCMVFGQVGDIDISQIQAKWTDFPYFKNWYNPSDIGTSLMCRSGQLSVSKKHCGEYEYDTSYPLMLKENADHFIECLADSDCYYKDNFGEKTTIKCECGYNEEGKGYCPLPNKINKDDWKQLNQYRSGRTDNQCHSLSRFSCYLKNSDMNNHKDLTEIEFRTTKAHLFYKAVPCAYKVLSSTRIHLSVLTITLMLLTLVLG